MTHGSSCCSSCTFDGVSPEYRRRLWIVIAINAVMFVAEIIAGTVSGSQALYADSLDFLADTLTYGMSLAVIGRPLHIRSNAATIKGISLLLMAIWVLGSTIYQTFILGVPVAPVMAATAVAAFAANAISVLLLVRYKDGDANVRSVWLCSRNDMIGNAVVILAAVGVWGTHSAWPDLGVAALMSALFLASAVGILRQSLRERKEAA